MSLGQILSVLGLLGVLGALAAAFLYGRGSGKDSAKVKHFEEDAEAYRTAREAERGVDALSDSDVADKLRSNWSR